MSYIYKKSRICFVGPFSVEALEEVTLDNNFVCYFLENAQITCEFMDKYDYIFVYDDNCSRVTFYCCSDPIVIDVDKLCAERCACAIMHMGGHGIGIDIADLWAAFAYRGKNTFYSCVSIDTAKQIVATGKCVSGVIFKVLVPKMLESTFGLDELEKVAGEIYELACEYANIIFDLELKPTQTELACELFVCESAEERTYVDFPKDMDLLS